MEPLMEAALTTLIAKQAITELNARYCRALDWLDESALEAVFWPDARIDYGFFIGNASEFVKTVMAMEQGAARRWHTCHNLLITIEGERAQAESYGISHGFTERANPVDRFYGGRYLDEYCQRGVEWRISLREYVLDWVQESSLPFERFITGDRGMNHHIIRQPDHPKYRLL